MAKKAETEESVLAIYIQEVEIHWTKASRGGEGAAKRNLIPQAVSLPPASTPLSPSADISLFLHKLYYAEANQYSPSSKLLRSDVAVSAGKEVFNRGRVTVGFDGTRLTAYYKWTEGFGVPRHRRQGYMQVFVPAGHSPVQKVFDLQVGQWGRILYNERHTDWDFGIWGYDQYVFNIGLFISPPRNVFLETEPCKVCSKMAQLW